MNNSNSEKKHNSYFCGFKYNLVPDEELKSKCCTSTKTVIYRVTSATFKLLLLALIGIFVIFPLIFKFSHKLQRAAVFVNFLNIPANSDFNRLEKYGLESSRNFYITYKDVILGVWQILPENLIGATNHTNSSYFENILGNGQNVFIYNHGNSGNRINSHRIELYKMLRKYFHVIAFDYRSFGDSSDIELTEEGVVEDSMAIYKWVQNKTKGHIFVWGHSLGTSIAMHGLALLQTRGYRPAGVILESPLNNLREETSEIPWARIFKHLPWFQYTIVEPIHENNLKFETDKHICKVDVPVIILHAEDDYIIPYKLGRKLYESGLQCRTSDQGSLVFHKFDRKYKYEHKHICRAPEILDIVMNFVSAAVTEGKEKHPE